MTTMNYSKSIWRLLLIKQIIVVPRVRPQQPFNLQIKTKSSSRIVFLLCWNYQPRFRSSTAEHNRQSLCCQRLWPDGSCNSIATNQRNRCPSDLLHLSMVDKRFVYTALYCLDRDFPRIHLLSRSSLFLQMSHRRNRITGISSLNRAAIQISAATEKPERSVDHMRLHRKQPVRTTCSHVKMKATIQTSP